MTKVAKIISVFFIVLILLQYAFVCAEEEIIKTEKGVMWLSKDCSAKIFLTENLELTVISKDDLKIVYHTRINNKQDVSEELKPGGSSSDEGKKYTIKNYFFSQRTIWMAIEVLKDGKRVNELTRTFYKSIYNPVAANGYWK